MAEVNVTDPPGAESEHPFEGVGVGVDVFVGVGVGVVEFKARLLSPGVMVNSDTSGLTTCMALVSRCSVAEMFCVVVLAEKGIVASSNVPVGGVERLVGSRARDRLIIPVVLASLAAVCLMMRVRGDGLVEISPVILTR